MKKLQPRIIGVNILGALGYILVLLAWVLLATVVVPLVFEESAIVPVQPPEVSTAQPMFSQLATGVSYVITAIMVVVTFGLLVVFHYLIGKWSSVALRWMLKVLRIVPTKRHLFLAKAIVTVLPLIGFFIVTLILAVPTIVISTLYITSVIAAVLALGCFLLQLIIARALKLPERLVW